MTKPSRRFQACTLPGCERKVLYSGIDTLKKNLCRTCATIYHRFAHQEEDAKARDRLETYEKMRVILYYESGVTGMNKLLDSTKLPAEEDDDVEVFPNRDTSSDHNFRRRSAHQSVPGLPFHGLVR